MLEVEFAELSDVGTKRDHNEDFLGHFLPQSPGEISGKGCLFVLADGVGGHERGEIASHLAVGTLCEGFARLPASEAHASLLLRLAQQANTNIYEQGAAHTGPGQRAMATTLVACALRFDRVTVAHVGDSRCYLLRGRQARQLTQDHTVAAEQLRLGLISSREAQEAQTSHLLSRSVGGDIFVNVEVNEHRIRTGDVLLLCSDGLHNVVEGTEMATVLQENYNLQRAAQRLVDLANQRDGGDNVSVQLIRVQGVEAVGIYRGRPYRLQ
jgi:protein phosphatase